ncbi:MAG: hypothetical protein WBL44_02740 [Nitrososphaeraceae archaeon]
MTRSPVRLLIIIIMLYSLIDAMRYEINRTSMIYANQTPQLPGIKVTSHVQGQQVPIDILSIMGISTDNSTSVCEVYMILNEIKPYQRVNPTGNNVTGNQDYSTWNYTFTPEYATIQEGNNRMVSKITCIDHSGIDNENLTKFNSLNITGIRIEGNAINSELSTLENPSLQPIEKNYSDSLQLQDLGSINPNPNNTVSYKNLQSIAIQEDILDKEGDFGSNDSENKDDVNKDEDVDYSIRTSKNEEDENEKDFLEKLHDRVLDQVIERLRESGIDFPK